MIFKNGFLNDQMWEEKYTFFHPPVAAAYHVCICDGEALINGVKSQRTIDKLKRQRMKRKHQKIVWDQIDCHEREPRRRRRKWPLFLSILSFLFSFSFSSLLLIIFSISLVSVMMLNYNNAYYIPVMLYLCYLWD